MGFSRQEYWSELPFPSPGDLPDPGVEWGFLYCRQILYCLRSVYKSIKHLCRFRTCWTFLQELLCFPSSSFTVWFPFSRLCSCLNSLLFALILLSLVIFRSCLQDAGHPNNQSLVLLVIVKTYFVFVSTCTLRKAVCIVLMDPRMRSLDGTHHITRTEMPTWEGQYSCPHAPPAKGCSSQSQAHFL